MSTTLPTVLTAAGLQPQTPASLRAQLLASVAATNPGYTANLPGSLIEDISSTDVGALVICDSARVEAVNSLTPFGANAFLLNQLGQIYGVQVGEPTNTSVDVVFSGPPGYVVPKDFVVSDGTFQYSVVDGGVVASGGTTDPLFCIGTVPGSWVVPAGTVTQLITSVPSTLSPPLSCNNPLPGVPGDENGESEESYRARVLQAGLAASQGMARYLRTLLSEVSGVQPRLVSPLLNGSSWEIIVGGGDPFQVAYAIWQALGANINSLVGSTLRVTAITNANPGVVTTNLNHGYVNGQVAQINGTTGIAGINGVNFTVTVVDEKRFSIGINTTSSGAYTGGGVVTPNLRNETPAVQDYPNTYLIPFVNPPQQTVTVSVTWNTTATNFVSASAVAQLGSPALIDYINSITVGQPLNTNVMTTVFQEAIATVLPPALLTRLIFAVSINSVSTAPDAGTEIIEGDPESYFFAASNAIAITQG